MGKNKSDKKKEVLQGRGLVLHEPAPWPNPVDGASLLREIKSELGKFLMLPDGSHEAIALWILHTYNMDAWDISPRLTIESPQRRCGKSQLLKVLNYLVWRPLLASNTTPASIFRAIDGKTPTLLIDEADSFAFRDGSEMRNILNAGHSREHATVIRTEGDSHEPRLFSAWAAVAIASIGNIPDTLEDRSIIVNMRRKEKGEYIEKLPLKGRMAYFSPLAQKARRWMDDHGEEAGSHNPIMPGTLNDRAADNWLPLLAFADLAGEEWPTRAREVAVMLSGDKAEVELSIQENLLSDIRDIYEEQHQEKLKSVDICINLTEIEDRPWGEWGRTHKPISPHQLASQLKRFKIHPSTIRFSDGPSKGYYLSDFRDAFRRYLPAPTVTGLQTNENGGNDADGTVTTSVTEEVTEGKGNQEGCNDVTLLPGDACPGCGNDDFRIEDGKQTCNHCYPTSVRAR